MILSLAFSNVIPSKRYNNEGGNPGKGYHRTPLLLNSIWILLRRLNTLKPLLRWRSESWKTLDAGSSSAWRNWPI